MYQLIQIQSLYSKGEKLRIPLYGFAKTALNSALKIHFPKPHESPAKCLITHPKPVSHMQKEKDCVTANKRTI